MGIDNRPTLKSVSIAYPLRYGSTGAFEMTETTLDAIKVDIRLLVMTNYGERVIHYDFGANLRPILFNQAPDVKQRIYDAITNSIEKWMPFVAINSIKIETSEDNPTVGSNAVNVDIDFSVSGTVLRATTGIISVAA